MNKHIVRRRSQFTLLIASLIGCAIAGCGGGSAPQKLPTFKTLYTFGTRIFTPMVVLPDGTVYAQEEVPTSPNVYQNVLNRYTDFGRGSATVVMSLDDGLGPESHIEVSPLNGNIYIPDRGPNAKTNTSTNVFNAAGQKLFSFDIPQSLQVTGGSGFLPPPMAIDSKGFAYMLAGTKFLKYDPNGNFVKAIPFPPAPTVAQYYSLAIDSKDILYIGALPNVTEYTTEGVLVRTFAADGGQITSISVDGVGNVYVADSDNGGLDVVSRFSPDGVLTAQEQGPNTCTVDASGNIYEWGGAIQVQHVVP